MELPKPDPYGIRVIDNVSRVLIGKDRLVTIHFSGTNDYIAIENPDYMEGLTIVAKSPPSGDS